ncbi:unnamed protein product [Durusdinium trenchii]|uniref:Uncharacterized protein n=1 Tax=Durusdinium trenchii TaxID=1381693 RepID=A0ABP0K973_9DINO
MENNTKTCLLSLFELPPTSAHGYTSQLPNVRHGKAHAVTKWQGQCKTHRVTIWACSSIESNEGMQRCTRLKLVSPPRVFAADEPLHIGLTFRMFNSAWVEKHAVRVLLCLQSRSAVFAR